MKWKKGLGIICAVMITAIIAIVGVIKSYDYNRLKPMITAKVKEITGRELVIGGDIDLAIGLTPSIVLEDVTFQNADWGSRPDMVSLKRLEARTAIIPLLSREIVIKRFVLVEPDILIEKNESGKSNLDFGIVPPEDAKETETPKPRDGARAFFPNLDFVEIKDGRLAYRDAATNTTHAVQIDSFELTPSETVASGLAAEMKGAYNDRAFSLTSDFGGFEAILDPKRNWPLRLAIDMGKTSVSVNGNVQDVIGAHGLNLAMTLTAESLADLPGLAPGALPEAGPLKIGLTISDPEANTYRVSDLAVTLQESDITGSATLKLGGKRPHVIADIASKHLDLRSLSTSGKDTAETSSAPGTEKDKVFPADPLHLEALSAVDADLTARFDQLLLPSLALNALSINISLNNGTFKIDPVKAGVGGGELESRIHLATRRDKTDISVFVQMSGVDVGRMMQELNAGDILEGTLDGDVALKGTGDSVAAIMAGLDGRILMKMGEGRLNNKYLNWLGVELTTGVTQLLDSIRKASEYADINCMVLNTEVTDGMARISPLVADTTNASVIGDGRVNLKTETLNVGFKTFPKEGTAGLSVSLNQLTKLVNLKGTLAHPTLGIDPYQTTLTVGKAVGGALIGGPAGIAAALVTEQGSENPCLEAIERAEAGTAADDGEKNIGEKTADSVKKIGESIGDAIKGLFGD